MFLSTYGVNTPVLREVSKVTPRGSLRLVNQLGCPGSCDGLFSKILAEDVSAHQLRGSADRERPVERDTMITPGGLFRCIALHRRLRVCTYTTPIPTLL